jgi:HEAT repeat protein
LSNAELLDLLIESLVDTDLTVRTEAARAIGHVGGAGAGHILKLRLLVAKEEPEVMGAVFAGLLAIDPRSAIPLVARSLDESEEIAAEAALALAATHTRAALDALLARRRKPNGPWLVSVLDNAIALTRLPEGMRFLLDLIAQDDRTANSAIEAISRVNTSAEVREQVQAAIAESGNDRLESLFHDLCS